jgi:hypothetical protein
MSPYPRMRESALGCALLLGLLADQLLRAEGRPGLNVALWAMAGTAVLIWVARRRVSHESWWLVGGALTFAWLLVLRDADALAVFCLFACVVLLGLAAGRGARAWATNAYIVDVAAAAVRVGALIALGPVGWSLGAARDASGNAPAGARGWPRVRVVARGTVMAVPPLIVLTALLAQADPVFEHVLQAALFEGMEPLLEHLAFAAVIAWLTSGLLRAFLVSDDDVMDRVQLPRPALAASEISFALTLVNVLFVAFLIVQARYLFGGASVIAITEGLTYAEYARNGFFELVTAAVLVVPMLLLADWAASEEAAHPRVVLRAMSRLLVVLLIGVLVSAAYRMKLYQDAYGLTELRLHVSVFMVWLTGVLVWLSFTVLRGRRRGFLFGAVAGGLFCIAALHVMNPHALIARVNLDRAAHGAQYDGRYLTTLSADAVPTLIARLPALPAAERCRVAALLMERWSDEREGGWRTWNLGDARARSLVNTLSAPAECVAVAVASGGSTF